MLRSALGMNPKSWAVKSLARVATTQRSRGASYHHGVVRGDDLEASAKSLFRFPVRSAVRPVGKRKFKKYSSSTGPSKHPESPDELARWGLKLNLENTHLSWSRNGIISTIAGVGMFQYLNAKGNHNGSLELPAYGLMVLGFGFFSIGTFTYMRRVAVLRSVMQLKTLEVGVMWAHSLIGLLAWVASASFLVTDGFSNRKLQWMQHMVQDPGDALSNGREGLEVWLKGLSDCLHAKLRALKVSDNADLASATKQQILEVEAALRELEFEDGEDTVAGFDSDSKSIVVDVGHLVVWKMLQLTEELAALEAELKQPSNTNANSRRQRRRISEIEREMKVLQRSFAAYLPADVGGMDKP
eukprot:INCI12728.2.p1 GENE.INCI12728.2~~INCI12728.2.p1  ORF type:complete len:356 (-),score=62.97 INCI12728.2:168-1235(-)